MILRKATPVDRVTAVSERFFKFTIGIDLKLTEKETEFLERRTRFNRNWPIFGAIAVLLVLGFTIWLSISRSLLINAWAVLSRLENGSIPDSTIAILAAMLPVVFIGCILVLIALIAFSFAAISNERRYLKLIYRLCDFEWPPT